MKIPRFWAKSTAEDVDSSGRPIAFSCWRSSDVSEDDARESALAVAQRTLRRWLAEGWHSGLPPSQYEYDSLPMREEVLERICDSHGETLAAVTQNAYGALVLNAARVLFIDLDFPPYSPWEWLWYHLQRLLRRPVQSPEEQREAAIRARLEAFVRQEPGGAVRLYRTFAGMRAIVIHKLYDPVAPATNALLVALGTDPLYIRLCRAQECFRARLSPKPWRCEHRANPIRWPRETEEAQQAFERWQAKYVKRQAAYATCWFRETLGSERVHPEAAEILAIHDRMTRCQEPLALA
ncbi:MAG: hypothetical protein JNG90_20120 [Planctomycetaceae bacterium]|nr:hypothetical protein [Planctomycetaceae bacterium]